MQELVLPNLTTILLEFIPPVILTSLYLFYIGSSREKRNNYFEVFILIMYANVFTFFLRTHLYPIVDPDFDPTVNLGTLVLIFLSNFFYHIGVALQEYMTWIMVSFYSALFCILLLAVRLVIWGRKGTLHRLNEWKEKSDYIKVAEGKSERFVCLPKTNLGEARREYFIIGLATIIPSIEIYIIPIMDTYVLNILIFLTWIYRFGYPASGRIADTADFFIQDIDFEYESKSHFGAFFKINVLISIVVLLQNIYQVLLISGTPGLELFVMTYLAGFALAFIPIISAVLVLPLVERYATIFCVRLVSEFMGLREKVSLWRASLGTPLNFRRFFIILLLILIYTILLTMPMYEIYILYFLIMILLPYLIVYLLQAYRLINLHWRAVWVSSVIVLVLFTISMSFANLFYILLNPFLRYWQYGQSNLEALYENLYSVMVLLIHMSTVFLVGYLGHRLRRRGNGGLVSFAFITGLIVTLLTWIIAPQVDYVIGNFAIPVEYIGIEFTRVSPLLFMPPFRVSFSIYLASHLLIDVAMRLFSFLFILYFLFYSRTETTGIGFGISRSLKKKP